MVAFLFLKSKINFDLAVFESNLKFKGEKFNISASKNTNIILTWPVKCRNSPKTCTHINDLNPHSNLQRKREKRNVVTSRKSHHLPKILAHCICNYMLKQDQY